MAGSNQSVSFPLNRILPVMAASTLAIVLGCLRYDQCYFNGIA
jgi:hypothetical protein